MMNNTKKLLIRYNASETSENERLETLVQMLGSVGKLSSVGQNFLCQCGKHIFGAIVLAGVTIGNSSVIGAGSVVTKSIPPYSVAVGNPCKILRNEMG